MPTVAAPKALSANAFIARWQPSGAGERANAQMFLSELCDLLGVARPDPMRPDEKANAYVFEKPVAYTDETGAPAQGRLDLYKRNCFVLETKQGVGAKNQGASEGIAEKKTKQGHGERGTRRYDLAMQAAREQAENYVRALPASEGNPPLLIVVDVGYSIEMYADFSRMGKVYTPYPDSRSFRIALAQLEDEAIRARLRLAWTDPDQLNPARISEQVTREVSEHLAKLGASLEKSGHAPEAVGHFLTRTLFTLFAEDVGLIPRHSFAKLLEHCDGDGKKFQWLAEGLWRDMDAGRYNGILGAQLRRFNGRFFHESDALPLSAAQINLLLDAARKDWSHVEPAIFGTLLERALNPAERHKLGAHYTPRAYVERLVVPTVIEPLRQDWQAVRKEAQVLLKDAEELTGKARDPKIKAVREKIMGFLKQLAATRVLDPACGSGNFLYVAMEHMKRLEGEVLVFLREVGGDEGLSFVGYGVDPHQFLGLELNPRAAALAELVLWIGYLQWHLRQDDEAQLRDPVLEDYGNIRNVDAVLAYDEKKYALTEDDRPKMRWDGQTMKVDATTGRMVPDEQAQVAVWEFVKPTQAKWPEAEFVVGNPPFIGASRMRDALGSGYAEALRETYPEVPESADFVMYWWHKAALLARAGKVKQFGLITTNSISQTFNRRVVEAQLAPEEIKGKKKKSVALGLAMAIADHPWVEASDGAAVRIAMTVGAAGVKEGVLLEVVKETEEQDGSVAVELSEMRGEIHADLTVGADVTGVVELRANEGMSSPGFKLHGAGFIVTAEQAQVLGLGNTTGLEKHIRPYRNGRDLTDKPRGVMVIDLFGLTIEEVRAQFPAVYQHVKNTVKPERDQNARATYRDNWWIFGEARRDMRLALAGLPRYIVTAETTKHRVFQFLDAAVAPDNALIAIALSDAYSLGILSSRVHGIFALATGSFLGVGNDPRYSKSRCFDPFPFPLAPPALRARIATLAEQIDLHRKRQQAQFRSLTLTDTYNILEKLRAGEKLSPKERATHAEGLVEVLLDLHRDLDRAVLEAYGWSDLADALAKPESDPAFAPARQVLLTRLVALNSERVKAEKKGKVLWLRPEYQSRP